MSVIAAITRIEEEIFRSVAGDRSVDVWLQGVIAEIILRVWFIKISYADLVLIGDTPGDRDIYVLAPDHGIRIRIGPGMEDRIGPNRVWV